MGSVYFKYNGLACSSFLPRHSVDGPPLVPWIHERILSQKKPGPWIRRTVGEATLENWKREKMETNKQTTLGHQSTPRCWHRHCCIVWLSNWNVLCFPLFLCLSLSPSLSFSRSLSLSVSFALALSLSFSFLLLPCLTESYKVLISIET